MADQWQDNSISSAQVKDDDDATPEDWEAELDKPEKSEVEEKPKESIKASSTTKSKSSNKNHGDNDEYQKTLKQSDGNYTTERFDENQNTNTIRETDPKNMVSESVDMEGKHFSLDNLNLLKQEEFHDYSLHLCNRLETLSKSEFYPDFIENFLDGITKSMSIDGVKRLQTTLQTIFLRKQSDEREKKAKSKSKKYAKPQLKTVRRVDYGAFEVADDNDFDHDVDYDDDDFI